MNALSGGTAVERREAAEVLAHGESESASAALALLKALRDEDDEVRDWAVAALEAIGAPAEHQVAEVVKLLEDESADVAYWAATLLGRLQRAGAPFASAVAKALATRSEVQVRRRAVWALAKIGASSSDVLAALKQAAADGDQPLARVAGEALRTLSPQA